MEEAATYHATPTLAPLPTLGPARPTHPCPTCHGRGSLGCARAIVPLGDHSVVTTRTHWCPTCGGAGRVMGNKELNC